VKTALRFGTILIGMVIVGRYATGAGRLIAQTGRSGVPVIKALQGR